MSPYHIKAQLRKSLIEQGVDKDKVLKVIKNFENTIVPWAKIVKLELGFELTDMRVKYERGEEELEEDIYGHTLEFNYINRNKDDISYSENVLILEEKVEYLAKEMGLEGGTEIVSNINKTGASTLIFNLVGLI